MFGQELRRINHHPQQEHSQGVWQLAKSRSVTINASLRCLPFSRSAAIPGLNAVVDIGPVVHPSSQRARQFIEPVTNKKRQSQNAVSARDSNSIASRLSGNLLHRPAREPWTQR